MGEFLNIPTAVPTPEVYQVNYSAYEDEVVENWNNYNLSIGAPETQWDAWVDITSMILDAKDAVQEIGGSEEFIHHQLRKLAVFGRVFVSYDPVENDQGEDSDINFLPNYRSQYAFALGYIQQQNTIERLYNGAMPFFATYEEVRASMNDEVIETDSTESARDHFKERLLKIGEFGLERMGYARGFVEKWTQEAYPGFHNKEEQTAFRTGHGVALYGSIVVHDRVNDILVDSIDFEGIEPGEFNVRNIDSTRDT